MESQNSSEAKVAMGLNVSYTLALLSHIIPYRTGILLTSPADFEALSDCNLISYTTSKSLLNILSGTAGVSAMPGSFSYSSTTLSTPSTMLLLMASDDLNFICLSASPLQLLLPSDLLSSSLSLKLVYHVLCFKC